MDLEEFTPAKAHYVLVQYGLTFKQVQGMFYEQRGRCAICQVPFIEGTYHIDHDHSTSRVRGLLCTRCNSGLGFFKDSISNLSGAIRYLEAHGKRSHNRER